MKRLQVQTLGHFGALTREEVAQRTDVSVSTVRRVLEETAIEDPEGTERARRDRMGRPSKVEEHRARIEAWLEEDPGIETAIVLERLRKAGCEAGKSAVYAFVRKLRKPAVPEGVVRFEAVAGEFGQHDFGQFRVRFCDGRTEVVRFFASRLKYSRMVHVKIVDNEQLETVCFALADAYTYFGGVPLVSVFDNPRTIVVDRKGREEIWNATFARFAVEVGITPMAHWPRRPQEKGSVENLVGFVKSSFFRAHRFRDHDDLRTRLADWHRWANDERVSRATGETPRARFLLESSRLRTLCLSDDGPVLRHTRVVRTDGYLEFEGLRYFAGFELVGRKLGVRVGAEHITIVVDSDRSVRHPRRPINGQYSVLPEQRNALVGKKGARPYSKRQLLMDLAPAAEWFFTEIRHRRPDTWKDDVDRAWLLLDRFGEEAMRRAFIECGRQELAGSEYLETILTGRAAVEGEEVER